VPSREAASSCFTAIWSQKTYKGIGLGGAEWRTIVYVVALFACLAAAKLCIGLISHRQVQLDVFSYLLEMTQSRQAIQGTEKD